MYLNRTVAPEELLSLGDMKPHLRVDGNDEEALITSLIAAAVSFLDGAQGILGRCLVTQTWEQKFCGFAPEIELAFPGVQSVVVSYKDSDDALQTVPASSYELLLGSGRSVIRFRPSVSPPAVHADTALPVTITMVAGYGAASAVPETAILGIKLLVAHWFENREAVTFASSFEELPFGVRALLVPHRFASF